MTAVTCTPEIVTEADGSVTVALRWTGVDRPVSHGISAGRDRRLAERLRAAVASGAAFADPPTVRTDARGETYVDAPLRVLGRRLNADLRRLGY